uniref:Uncharacterized protein n=1 Tax=Anguilla anguilla TaxID=7936 RepID=A0A0E9TTK3_ANGAN
MEMSTAHQNTVSEKHNCVFLQH